MRTVKFRGKITDREIDCMYPEIYEQFKEKNFWIEGNLIFNEGRTFIVGDIVESTDEYISLEYWYPVVPETVCQFAYKYDYNGKEIYEEDICIHRYIWQGYYLVVKHIFAGFQTVAYKKPNVVGISDGINEYLEDSTDLIVVGNTRDNPELLGGIK